NDAPFADYGVDSIVGVNLVRTINAELQIDLETVSLFEYSTVDELAGHILKNWGQEIAGQLAPVNGSSQESAHSATAAPAPAAVEIASAHRFIRTEPFADERNIFSAGEEDDAHSVSVEPIAIIGMSGRF